MLLPIVAIVIVVAAVGVAVAFVVQRGRLKRCPYCMRMVRSEASVCPYCTRELD
jgi:hypothetical protein